MWRADRCKLVAKKTKPPNKLKCGAQCLSGTEKPMSKGHGKDWSAKFPFFGLHFLLERFAGGTCGLGWRKSDSAVSPQRPAPYRLSARVQPAGLEREAVVPPHLVPVRPQLQSWIQFYSLKYMRKIPTGRRALWKEIILGTKVSSLILPLAPKTLPSMMNISSGIFTAGRTACSPMYCRSHHEEEILSSYQQI